MSTRKRKAVRSASPTHKKRKLSKSPPPKKSENSDDEVRKTRVNKTTIISLNEGKTSKIVNIYGFGNNGFGQLAVDPEKVDKKTEASLIGELEEVNCLDVVCGDFFNIVVESSNVTKHRKVYNWGTMQYVRDKKSKTEMKDDDLPFKPDPLEILNKVFIVQASAGESHAAVLSSEGHVYTWGIYKDEKAENIAFKPDNKEFQQEPELIEKELFQSSIIVQIASTGNRTLALTQSGEVYEWGYSKNRVSGRNASRSFNPSIVHIQEKVRAIFCGVGDTSFVIGDNSVYAWGNNENYQLGIDKLKKDSKKDEDTEVKSEDKSKKGSKEKTKEKSKDKDSEVKSDDKSKNQEEKSKSKEEGKKVVKRERKKKELYYRPSKAILINNLIKELKLDNDSIKKICGGHDHTVLLLNNGDVYSWGRNNYGQLGLGQNEEIFAEPSKIDLADIVDVSCGAYHTLLVNKDGEFFACGRAKDGRFPSDNEQENKPIELNSTVKIPKKNQKVISVRCGKKHNLLVTEKIKEEK